MKSSPMKAREFLSEKEKADVVAAIKAAELGTSGEIRIHLDEKCSGDPMKRAVEVFRYLKMDRTELHNGVLIYVACQSKVFAIVGDSGINNAVPKDFWHDVSQVMHDKFSEGHFAEGLAAAARMAGEKLKEYFPYSKDDVNELPDEISFGKNDKSDPEHK